MKIVVIGGGGPVGSKLVTKLRERGHKTPAASPASGVNTLTCQGLAAALEGASVVTDVSNDPREVITDPHATYYGAELHERTLVPAAGACLAKTRFDQWQNQSTIGNS